MAQTEWHGIFTRLEPAKRKALKVAAANHDMTTSEFVRFLVDEALRAEAEKK